MKENILIVFLLSCFFAQSSFASETVMNVQLPFPDGYRYVCTQNSDESFSHQFTSTKYDLDFGMVVGSIIVASADGIFYGKPDDGSGFGNYAKVQHSNGYWTIYAHLSGFIARNGDTVVAGQPIAYSGNSGFSIGSGGGYHLHFGVHKEDNGIDKSYPMNVYAMDKSAGNVLDWFRTGLYFEREFVCGIDGSGHLYESRPVGRIFSDYSCVKLIDGSVLCWIGNPTTCEDGKNHVWYHNNSSGEKISESDSNTWSKCLETSTKKVSIYDYLNGGYGIGGGGTNFGENADLIPDYDVYADSNHHTELSSSCENCFTKDLRVGQVI